MNTTELTTNLTSNQGKGKTASTIALAGLLAGLLAIAGPAAAQDTSQKDNKGKAGASTSAAASGKSGKDMKSDAGGKVDPVLGAVLVVLPMAQAGDDRLGDGCWVRFYDHRNFAGSNLTLVGPVDMPNMTVPGAVWRDWDSAMIGPKARVTTYDNEGFRDRTASLAPGQQIPDLHDKKLGWFDEIHSARVTCSG